MALIQTSLIWVTYAVAVAILLVIAAVFVYLYQAPRERSAAVSTVCILTILSLLATVLLLPVDVALVSSTADRALGRKKEWATPDAVDAILYQLRVVYYLLYSLDAVLCLLIIPFTYFLYEEYDQVEAEEGTQTLANRIWGAFKYTSAFIAIVVVLFLVGFFIPISRRRGGSNIDLDFFKNLLLENHGERALTFAISVLITIGTILYCIYTGPGLALLPLTLIKTAPSISAPDFAAETSSALTQNRERQRQLQARGEGRQTGLEPRDRRELEGLVREERTLVRRERLAAEAMGEDQHWTVRTWHKICTIFRPLKVMGGILLVLITLVVWTSMLITAIDKLKNSSCGASCGYLLAHSQIFQPINAILVSSSKLFPLDYILFLLLTLLFFASSIVGIATVGIRFLWLTLFRIRAGHTRPQALLLATVLLTLTVLATNHSLVTLVAPQYASFGAQTFCDRPAPHPGSAPDCSHNRNAVLLCRESPLTDAGPDDKASARRAACTPTVASTFLNRANVNFPLLGLVDFWAQLVFLALFALVFVVMLFQTPKLDEESGRNTDEDLHEEEEEEGLLASTGRRLGASWGDITGQAVGLRREGYGATAAAGGLRSGRDGVEGEGQ